MLSSDATDNFDIMKYVINIFQEQKCCCCILVKPLGSDCLLSLSINSGRLFTLSSSKTVAFKSHSLRFSSSNLADDSARDCERALQFEDVSK